MIKETEPFLATMKLVTGEEVISEVMATDEEGEDFFVLGNPIVIAENQHVENHACVDCAPGCSS